VRIGKGEVRGKQTLVEFSGKSGGCAAVLTILPSGLPPLPLTPFPSLPKAPLVVPKGAFLPDDFFFGVFPMSAPSLAPASMSARHIQFSLTCTSLTRKPKLFFLRESTARQRTPHTLFVARASGF
jgi:hypothetical protein